MQGVRIGWDPELPTVASQGFTAGDRTFRADEPFPWRDLGVTEQNAFEMWRAGLIRCEATKVEAQSAPPPKASEKRKARSQPAG